MVAALLSAVLISQTAPTVETFKAWLEDVESSSIKVFGASSGKDRSSLTGLKIVQAGEHDYIAIHTDVVHHDYLSIRIHRSRDLKSWTPAAPPEHGIMGVALHRTDHRWIMAVDPLGVAPFQLRGYSSLENLLEGRPDIIKKLPIEWAPVLGSEMAITSVNVRGSDWRDVDVSLSFCYLTEGMEKKLGSGTLTGFSKWTSQSCDLENAQISTLYKGDIIPCDSFETEAGRFDLVNVKENGDWDSPRITLLRFNGGSWTRVVPKTAGGSSKIFDPRVSVITLPNGSPGLAAAWTILNKQAAPGENGTLIYAKPLPS
jgi:hypothetical protein